MKHYKPTLAEQWAIKAMLLHRYPKRVIQQAFGIGRNTISKIMAEMPFLPKGKLATKTILGIRTPLEKRVEEMILSRKYETLTDIAKEAGCSRERIRQIAAELGDSYYRMPARSVRISRKKMEKQIEKLERKEKKQAARKKRIDEMRELWNNPAISTKEFARRMGYAKGPQAINRLKRSGSAKGFLNRLKLLKGEFHPRALKEEDIKPLSDLWMTGISYKEMGKKLGVGWRGLQAKVSHLRKRFPNLFPPRPTWRK